MATSIEPQVQQKKASGRRPHMYELDPLRAITALCVIGVHVVGFTVFLNHSVWGADMQNAVSDALHYTREMFMFVSGVALVYVYYGRPFKLSKFWQKRGLGVVVPYCLWSIFYVWFNTPSLPPGQFISTSFFDILKGSASFQLYYILLSIQFYIILPLFLLFMRVAERHPWRTLAVSFIIQVAVLYFNIHYLQPGNLPHTSFWAFVNQYLGTFILTYQFYFIMGGLFAIYREQVHTFVLSHGRWIVAFFVASLAVLWLDFYVQISVFHVQMDLATSVLQPVVALYTPGIIVFLYWLAARWAVRIGANGRPKWYAFWHTLSDASFGVYLVQVVFIVFLLRWFLPKLPEAMPVAVHVFLVWFLTAVLSVLTTVILLNIPVLSRLVGRPASPDGINFVKKSFNKLFARSPQDSQAPEMRKGQRSQDAQRI
jgi:peptidoglycan/LPS O-acetylase OafA/YrhL